MITHGRYHGERKLMLGNQRASRLFPWHTVEDASAAKVRRIDFYDDRISRRGSLRSFYANRRGRQTRET
jgi:hypothetical protein